MAGNGAGRFAFRNGSVLPVPTRSLAVLEQGKLNSMVHAGGADVSIVLLPGGIQDVHHFRNSDRISESLVHDVEGRALDE